MWTALVWVFSKLERILCINTAQSIFFQNRRCMLFLEVFIVHITVSHLAQHQPSVLDSFGFSVLFVLHIEKFSNLISDVKWMCSSSKSAEKAVLLLGSSGSENWSRKSITSEFSLQFSYFLSAPLLCRLTLQILYCPSVPDQLLPIHTELMWFSFLFLVCDLIEARLCVVIKPNVCNLYFWHSVHFIAKVTKTIKQCEIIWDERLAV